MENTVPENLCKERMRLQDERFARDKQRIDKVEQRLDDVEHEQSDAGKALLKLTTMEEQDRAILDDHEKRIGEVENRRLLIWDKILYGVLGAIGTYIVKYFFG